MSEKEYVTVPCRVQAGLLKEGETLEIRKPSGKERVIGWDTRDQAIQIIDDCSWGDVMNGNLPVIIPAFDANDWAEKNLPKPACGREVWVVNDAGGDWYTGETEPVLRTSSWHMLEWRSISEHLFGPCEFKLPWQQSKFKWCLTWKSPDGKLHEQKGADAMAGRGEWHWVWHGGVK